MKILSTVMFFMIAIQGAAAEFNQTEENVKVHGCTVFKVVQDNGRKCRFSCSEMKAYLKEHSEIRLLTTDEAKEFCQGVKLECGQNQMTTKFPLTLASFWIKSDDDEDAWVFSPEKNQAVLVIDENFPCCMQFIEVPDETEAGDVLWLTKSIGTSLSTAYTYIAPYCTMENVVKCFVVGSALLMSYRQGYSNGYAAHAGEVVIHNPSMLGRIKESGQVCKQAFWSLCGVWWSGSGSN